jgi:hypothetical protein
MNSVVPNRDFIKRLRYPYNSDSSVGALDFVSDAFYDMAQLFFDASSDRRIPTDSLYLTKIKATVGYIDPILEYREHLNLISDTFLNTYILENRLQSKITDPITFVNSFLNFFKLLTDHYPITLTGWNRSVEGNPFGTGLFLDLSEFGKDRDDLKDTEFIQDPAFGFYVNACVKHGFMVSRNNPSIICADIASVSMLPYMEKYEIFSTSRVFDKRYTMTHELDLGELRRFLFNMYEGFITQYPFYRTHDICERTSKITTNITYRNGLIIDDFDNIINNNYLINLYINIRNIEENYVFGKPDIERISRQAKFLKKKVDSSKAIRYIDEQYRSTFRSKPGGIKWYANWFRDRETKMNL